MKIISTAFVVILLSGCAIKYEKPKISIHPSSGANHSGAATLALQQMGVTLQKVDGVPVHGEAVNISPGKHQVIFLVRRTPSLSASYSGEFEAQIDVKSSHVYEIANISNTAANAELVLLDKGLNYDTDCLYLRRLLYGYTHELQNKCGNRRLENGQIQLNTNGVETSDIVIPIVAAKIK